MTAAVRSPDPQALMAQVRDGDRAASEAALADLVGHFQDELIGFFYHLSFDQLVAEELAQDVFVNAYRARERWLPTATVRTWLYRIAHNRWIDHLRARRHHLSLDARHDEGGEAFGATIAAPDHTQRDRDAEDIRDRVQSALDLLPAGQREVFVMANNHGLKYHEIGEILGIPEGTVKSRMHHAVRTLREELADLVEGAA